MTMGKKKPTTKIPLCPKCKKPLEMHSKNFATLAIGNVVPEMIHPMVPHYDCMACKKSFDIASLSPI